MKPYKLVGFQTKPPSALTNAQQNLISFQLRLTQVLKKGDHRKLPQTQQDHLGNTPEVKITPGIVLTNEVHDKKTRPDTQI